MVDKASRTVKFRENFLTMKKLAAISFIGFGSLLNPAVASATEDFFAPIELSAQDRVTLISQAEEGLSFEDVAENTPMKRADGFYFPLSIGGQQFSGFDIEKTMNKSDYNGTANYGLGLSGETGLGYKFGDFRTEVLYGYSHMPGEDFSLSGIGKFREGSSDDSNMQTLTLGLLYDIDTNSRWTPYVGGQLGVGWFNLGEQNFEVGNREFKLKEQTQAAFVYGGKVGLSYQVSREWDLFVEGGYLRNNSYDFDIKETGDTRTVINDTERAVDRVISRDVNGDPFTIAVYEPNQLTRFTTGEGRRLTCREIFGNTGFRPNGSRDAFPICYREIAIATDRTTYTNQETHVNGTGTKVINVRPNVSDMNFGPADGWSVRIGFRWFFNQPKIKEVAVVADPESEVKEEPTPVRGLW